MPATLRWLLETPGLDLELHHGEPDTPYLAVRHVDRHADRHWLAPGDLRLSEATSPQAAVDSLRADSLFSQRPAVIVYLRDPRRRALPSALLKRSVDSNVALLSAPPATSPERVEEAALAGLVAASEGLAPLASVQRYLMTGLDGPKPEREVLDRVNRLSGVSLALLTPWGETVARSGSKHARLGQRDLEGLQDGRLQLAEGQAFAMRVVARGRVRGVLLAFDDDPEVLTWLELCRALLTSAALQRSAEAQQDRGRKGALLAEWLAGPQAAELLRPRLYGAGLDLDNDYVVAVAEVGPKAKQGRVAAARAQRLLERLREAADEYFLASGHGALSEARADHNVWVYAAGAPRSQAEPLLRALKAAAVEADAPVPVRVGLSLPRNDLSAVADAYHQAMLALKSVPGPEGLAWFDQFDPLYWVLKQQPSGNLATVRDRLVGPVKAADDGKLWRTLDAYLLAPSDLNALAKQLHIHVNTLRYRLKRIESLIEAPLDSPETLAKLYLAQQIDAMLERDEGVGVAG